jgi:NTE family protein
MPDHRRRWRVVAALGLALLTTACATHFENQPLAAGQQNPERRAIALQAPEQPLILVAISGGGSRAAALGWAVLRDLRDYRYTAPDGSQRSLTDDIAVVSSVSGGSVIAADFALNGAAGLDRFEQDFLVPDNTRTLGVEALSPVTWFSLAVSGASRSQLVEQMLDRQLFHGQTFAALNQPGKPYLILNTTDMASGEVFAFTPNRFDDICADLDAQAISTGVAASAAVPVVFTPIALRNYAATPACIDRPVPSWVGLRLNGTYAPYLNVDNFKLARYVNDLRHGPDHFRQIDYLYFLDGGLADNLGVHGLLEAVSSPYAAPLIAAAPAGAGAPGTLLNAINTGRVKKLVVLVINARADPANKIYQSDRRPGILGMINSVTSVPIDSTTNSVGAQIDVLLSALNAASSESGSALFSGLKVYDIQIDFDQLRANDPVQRALRDRAKAVPTLWTISHDNLQVIEQAGTTLLHQHPCFQRLLLDLSIPASFADRNFAFTGCRQATDP